MVRPERFELPTYSSGGCRSIQLSYGRTPVFPVYMRSFGLSIIRSTVSAKLQLNDRPDIESRIATSSSELIPVAPTTPAAVSSAPSAAITAASTAAFDFGTRLIDVQSAPANLAAVHRCDGFLAVFRACHFDEAEAPRSAGIAVSHDAYPVHLSVCLEQPAQFVFRSIEVKVANENVLHANASQ
jgi:hypothetical protein